MAESIVRTFAGLAALLVLALAPSPTGAIDSKLATPQMGWNSYNHYGCVPTEEIMKTNAQGLVDHGLAALGYVYVTPDCGWMTSERDNATGQLVWNSTLFPSGGPALGEFLHGLGLKFGVYSGGGYYQCDSVLRPASLGHETLDAQTFASWGADSLKYDNCYSTSPTDFVDYSSPQSSSPDRYYTMAHALNATDRDMIFQVCQWGCGTDLEEWAPPIAQSWRISNDIQDNWISIYRIVNEAVPYWKATAPGQYPDLDMLIVGLNILTPTEEMAHFGFWAINKSPLIVGAPLGPNSTTPASSLAILGNAEVVAINQDPLGAQARLVRRYTEEGYDIWAGNLSGSRMVVGLANWNNVSQPVTLNLAAHLGLASAGAARDPWASKDLGTLTGNYTANLAGHELHLLVLSNLTTSKSQLRGRGYYTAAANATLGGNATIVQCNATQCAPAASKATNLGTATFRGVSAGSAGTKTLGVDYCQYDVALGSAWNGATNTRNMTVAVNGGAAKNWAWPIAGGDWFDSGRLMIDVDGFVEGSSNTVVFAAVNGTGPDLVGFELFELGAASTC